MLSLSGGFGVSVIIDGYRGIKDFCCLVPREGVTLGLTPCSMRARHMDIFKHEKWEENEIIVWTNFNYSSDTEFSSVERLTPRWPQPLNRSCRKDWLGLSSLLNACPVVPTSWGPRRQSKFTDRYWTEFSNSGCCSVGPSFRVELENFREPNIYLIGGLGQVPFSRIQPLSLNNSTFRHTEYQLLDI